MRIVEPLSEKKKKNVQRAEAKTPEQDNLAPTEDVSNDEREASDVAALPFDLSTLDPKKIQLAESMGIPIRQLIAWTISVERRFKIIAEEVATAPQKVVDALKAEGLKAQQERLKQGGVQPQQDSRRLGLTDLVSVLQSGGGGGGMDAEMMKLTKDMMSMNIQRMKNDMGFTDAIKKAIVSKIAGKATTDIMEV